MVLLRLFSVLQDGDAPTMKLLRDLRVATITYTRKSMADSSIPTQVAIDEARHILSEAQLRLAEVGDEIEQQIEEYNVSLCRLSEGRPSQEENGPHSEKSFVHL